MIFHSQEVLAGLMIASMPAVLSIYLFFILKNERWALFSLFLSALLLRLVIISIDPFLQDWDERFHALVAKNMILHPFVPMLRVNPILEYDPAAWCCNHIWLHKQPLFLWQMALSMKLFGVHLFSLRLPSALLGAITIFFTYDIAKHWTKDTTTAFLSALLLTFSFYQLELTSARFTLEHNDIAFIFYVTASIWAFVKYIQSKFSLKWAVAIGILVGCAVLNKWLTGFLIFGGWGLYLLLNHYAQVRGHNSAQDSNSSESKGTTSSAFSNPHSVSKTQNYLHFAMAILISFIVFMPWQIYIINAFPLESAIEYAHNRQHIFEVVGGHHGSAWFYLNGMRTSYGQFLLPFLLIGLVSLLKEKAIDRFLSYSFFAMILVVYAFFSIVVAMKMPTFTYLVNSLIIILIAQGIITSYNYVMAHSFKLASKHRALLISFLVIAIGIYSLKPWNIAKHRSSQNTARNSKINNTQIYQSLDDSICQNYVVLNCKSFESIELMFHKDVTAFHWFPNAQVIDSLENLGYKFAAFQSHTNQGLPGYMLDNENILIIEKALK